MTAYNFVYSYGSLKVDDVMGFLMEEAGLEEEGKEEGEKNIEEKKETNHDKEDPELEVPKTTERSILKATSTMPQSDSSDPD